MTKKVEKEKESSVSIVVSEQGDTARSAMTNRQRVNVVLHYQNYDRLPIVHFGYWRDTLQKWAAEGNLTKQQAEEGGEMEILLILRLRKRLDSILTGLLVSTRKMSFVRNSSVRSSNSFQMVQNMF